MFLPMSTVTSSFALCVVIITDSWKEQKIDSGLLSLADQHCYGARAKAMELAGTQGELKEQTSVTSNGY